jgi:hypothetical protein
MKQAKQVKIRSNYSAILHVNKCLWRHQIFECLTDTPDVWVTNRCFSLNLTCS